MRLRQNLSVRLVLFVSLSVWIALTSLRGGQAATDYRRIYQTGDGFISVRSNGDLDVAKARKLAARVREAYDFVIEVQQWRTLEPLRAPLQVHVKIDMKAGLLGSSTRDVFTIGLSYLDNPLSLGTLAHELTHCQDDRQLAKRHIPHYLMEGRALLVGRAYREKVGQGPGAYDRNMKKRVVEFTADDAREVLAELPGEKEPEPGPLLARLEFMGCFFMEFMRTRLRGGLSDIQPRTARVVEDVGQGLSYEDAFRKEVGVSLAEARKAFVADVAGTEGHPKARLKGTIWQDL
jgi:hypothetical protein